MTAHESQDHSEPGPDEAPLAKPGARWTPEEKEQLVDSVRAGTTDIRTLAARHGRTPGAIVARLLTMIPEDEKIPDDERLDWIVARLTSDPDYDWRSYSSQTQVTQAAMRPIQDAYDAKVPGKRLTEPEGVLAIWQRITRIDLADEHETRFLASKEIDDLTAFDSDALIESGTRLHQAHGGLRLNAWTLECAVPGLTELQPAADMAVKLEEISRAVRVFVAALVNSVSAEEDREVLRRRLGLDGEPETLNQIGDALGLSHKQAHRCQEQAVKAATSTNVRHGYQTSRDHAAAQLALLLIRDDGTVDPGRVAALVKLGFPRTESSSADRLITAAAKHAGAQRRQAPRTS